MKKLLTVAFIIIGLTSTAQKKDNQRYFEVMFYGVDSIHQTRYGTYFFYTKENYFPTLEEVYKIVIDGYRLNFTYNTRNLSLIISEFKNKEEYYKFNREIK